MPISSKDFGPGGGSRGGGKPKDIEEFIAQLNAAMGGNPAGLGPMQGFNPGRRQEEEEYNSPYLQDYSGLNIAPQVTMRREPQRVAPQVNLQAKQGGTPADALDALFQELLGQYAGGMTFDYESAMADTEEAIRQAYADDIRAIRGSNRRARRQTATNREDVEQMYNALDRTYQRAGKRAIRQGDRLADRMTGISKEAAGAIGNQAEKILNQQAAMAEGLGIEAALPEITAAQADNTTKTMRKFRREGAQDAKRQIKLAGNQQQYMEDKGVNAQLEGSNRSADLLADLQDYVQGNMDQIRALKSDRNREISAAEQQIQSGAAEAQTQNLDSMWDALMQYANLKMNIENTQADNDLNYQKYIASQQEGGGSNPGLSDFLPDYRTNYAEVIGRSSRPQLYDSMLRKVFNRPEFVNERFQTAGGEYMDMTTAKAVQLAVAEARRQGVPEKDMPYIRAAAEAYAQQY